jgi:catechol 2,3-dioxygenase-like lactoylglutathione lyase family enzyme
LAAVNSFCHVYLPVADLDEAIEFYTRNLGFSVFRRWTMGPSREAAYLELGEVLLEMSVPQGDAAASTFRPEARFGLAVSDLEALLNELRSNGVEVMPEGPPPRSFYGRQVRIKDPSGWFVALREWREPDGPRCMGWKPANDGTQAT